MVADPEDGLRPLACARILFGLLFLVRTTPVLAPLGLSFLPRAGPLLGWPDAHFHAPIAGLLLPSAAVATLCVLRTVAALAFLLGIATRPAGLVAGACGYLVLAQDAFGYVQTLHLLFLGTMVLALTDAGSRLALRPSPPRAPASSVRLLVVLVASIYFWAALAKVRTDWLDGRTLALYRESGGLAGVLAPPFIATAGRRAAAAWLIMLAELALSPLLLFARTRRFAVVLALAFHAAIEVIAVPDLFGWLMAALLVGCLARGGPNQGGQGEQRARAAGQATSA